MTSFADSTIKVLVFNAQTATAVTTNLRRQASERHIPTVAITETLQPPTATFQAWQVAQLQALQRVEIVACGSSRYAGMIGEYFLESLGRLPVRVHAASEFRARRR